MFYLLLLSISPQKFQNVYKKTKQKTYRFPAGL